MLPSSATCPLTSVSHLQPVVRTFPAFIPLFIRSVIHAFPPCTDAHSLTAVMLTALLLCAHGAPVEIASTDSPGGESSGEDEVEPTDPPRILQAFKSILGDILHEQSKVRVYLLYIVTFINLEWADCCDILFTSITWNPDLHPFSFFIFPPSVCSWIAWRQFESL